MTFTIPTDKRTMTQETPWPDLPTEQSKYMPVESAVVLPDLPDDQPGITTEAFAGLPKSFVDQYVDAAIKHANVTEIEPGEWFAKVVVIKGAYGEGTSPEEAISVLRETLYIWIEAMREDGVAIPLIEGFDLNSRAA